MGNQNRLIFIPMRLKDVLSEVMKIQSKPDHWTTSDHVILVTIAPTKTFVLRFNNKNDVSPNSITFPTGMGTKPIDTNKAAREFWLKIKADVVKWRSTNESVNESLSSDIKNAKNLLKDPHTITDIQYKQTRRGDKYIQINYKKNYVAGKMYDPEGQFVSIFYEDDKDLVLISKELKLKLKKSVNEALVKGKTYGGSKCEGGCFMGKEGLKKIFATTNEIMH